MLWLVIQHFELADFGFKKHFKGGKVSTMEATFSLVELINWFQEKHGFTKWRITNI